MAGLRSYDDPCGIARALDLIGERWSLLVVRELLYGPKRFGELRRGLTGASPNVLSQRLRELEEGGVIEHAAGASTYALTARGQALRPMLLALGRWGAGASPRPPGPLSVDALMAALEATFVPERAAELRGTLALRLGDDRFVVALDRGQLSIVRGAAARPDAEIDAEPEVLRAVVFGAAKPSESTIEIRGDKALARVFLRAFARP